ncbi:hypothetical protein ABK040_015771 [Willaertia magna]
MSITINSDYDSYPISPSLSYFNASEGIITTRTEIYDADAISPLSWTFYAVYSVWFFVLFTLVILRRNYQPVKSRDVFLMCVSLIATYFIAFMTTWRFAFGRHIFPCFFFILILYMSYPGVFLPSILRCWRLFFVYKLSQTKEKATGTLERRQSLFKGGLATSEMNMLSSGDTSSKSLRKSPRNDGPIIANNITSLQHEIQNSDVSGSSVGNASPLVHDDNILREVEESDESSSDDEGSSEDFKHVTSQTNSPNTSPSISPNTTDMKPNVPQLHLDANNAHVVNTNQTTAPKEVVFNIPPEKHDEDKVTEPITPRTAATSALIDPDKIQRYLRSYNILVGKPFLLSVLFSVYFIHIVIFAIVVLADLNLYSSERFLHGCPAGSRVYAVLALTVVYVVVDFILLFIIWRSVKETWRIREECLAVMLIWIVVVIIFFVFGVWGAYSSEYEHYVPAGWIILIGCVSDNVISCLIPVLLSFYTSRFSYVEGVEEGKNSTSEIQEVLYDKKARELFKEFAIQSFVPESVLFWEDARNFKKLGSTERKKKFLRTMIDKYISDHAALELNLPNRKEWERQLTEKINEKRIPDNVLQKLVNHVERDMMDLFVRWKRTSEYKAVKEEIERKKKETQMQEQVGMI